MIKYDSSKLGLWHHDIDLGNGARTKYLSAPYNGKEYTNKESVAADIVKLYGDDLKSKSVLDVACNAGGHLFALSRYGIASGFGFDVRKVWIEQAKWVQRKINFDTSNLKFAQGDFDVLNKQNNFDITLFNGIFYHLAAPVDALKRVADKTNELITINTSYAITPEGTEPCLVCRPESKRVEDGLSGVEGLSWRPNGEQVLFSILKSLGFVETKLYFKNTQAERLCVFASKIPGLLSQYRS